MHLTKYNRPLHAYNFMTRYQNNREDKYFASKRHAILTYSPCWIAIISAWVCIAMGLEATTYVIVGSLLALVCGSLALCRRKIMRQDQVIQQLQEQLQEVVERDRHDTNDSARP